MNYYIDMEFIEGFHKPWFGKRRHFIDLISIGIVCEDGSEFRAISSEYEFNKASDWVKDNVIKPLYTHTVPGMGRQFCSFHDFHKSYGITNKEIVKKIGDFMRKTNNGASSPVFYGYYSDYDWVLFASLYGTMMDLPAGFPMYCRDLQQMWDEKVELSHKTFGHDKKEVENFFRGMNTYPKQSGEHDALEDARWNKKFHEFLLSI